jgi:hypothetical protein
VIFYQGKYVSNVQYLSPGHVVATFSSVTPGAADSAINASALVYSATPVAGGGTILGNCTRTSKAATTTNILNEYLPTPCRGQGSSLEPRERPLRLLSGLRPKANALTFLVSPAYND